MTFDLLSNLVLRDRLELPPPDYKTGILPHEITEQIKQDTFLTNALPIELIFQAENVGIEPTTDRLI